MKTRKTVALLLSAILLLGLLAACGPQDDTTTDTTGTPGGTDTTPAPTPTGQQPGVTSPDPGTEPGDPGTDPSAPVRPANFNSKTPRDTFVIGTPEMNGDFINGFGNSSYDKAIKVLLGYYEHHSATYYTTAGGQIALNTTVVRNVSTSVDADGNKTYTFDLNPDLKWSDGTPITADEYVAGLMLYASPEFQEAGASSAAGDGLLGGEAYIEGETKVFAGAHVLGPNSFSLTIDAEQLPYFWETSYVMYHPIPMRVWLPGISIVSGPEGSSFSGDITPLCANIVENERYGPSVSSGPYMFVSFDGTTVLLQRNPYFAGDPEGYMPTFEWIIQMVVSDVTDVDMVIAGDLDLSGGNIEGSKIEAAKASEFAVAYSYLRAGYGMLAFACDYPPVDDPNVRWAVSCMIDRNAIIDHVLEGYGGTVDAAYGMAQWTYQSRRREIAQRLQPIAFNLDRANDFLDQTDWVFEADGSTPFDRSKVNAAGTYMRHNSAGEMLVIHHLSASTSVGGAIESEVIKNSPMIGMKYELTHGDFNDLLDNYYFGYELGPDRYFHAFNLASNYSAVPDPYWDSWHSDMLGSWENSSQYATPELDAIIMEMRSLDPSETERHADLWVEFQVEWQRGLPQIPLYSNEYFDIYNNVIVSLPTSPYASFEEIICQVEKWPE